VTAPGYNPITKRDMKTSSIKFEAINTVKAEVKIKEEPVS
jgi:hypothetical protein